MSRRVEALKRRVSSGRPGWEEALIELCAMTEDRPTFIDVLSTLLHHLSQHQPPSSTNPESHTVPADVQLALTVLGAVAAGVRQCQIVNSTVLGIGLSIKASVRRYWPSMQKWCSFLMKTYIEGDRPFFNHFRVAALTNIVALYAALYSHNSDILRTEEFRAIPGAPDVIIRAHFYSLLLLADTTSFDCEDTYHNSRLILDKLIDDRDGFWWDLYQATGEEISPTYSPKLASVLVQLCQEREINYSVMCLWIFGFTHAAASCNALHQRLVMTHNSVYFVTHLLSRISKRVHSKASLREGDVLLTWKWAVRYLIRTFRYGGYVSIIRSLDSGLLSSLWRFSQASERINPPLTNDDDTANEMYGNLLEMVAAASLYRTVQKVLLRILRKHPQWNLHEADEAMNPLLSQTGSDSKIAWAKFKKTFHNWVNLRNEWENLDTSPSPCSNSGCISSPRDSKFFLCAGCRLACYCGRECQKHDWEHRHRDECREDAQEQADRPIARHRDLNCLTGMIAMQLWDIRKELLEMQDTYRHDSSSTVSPDEVLVNIVDYTSTSVDKQVWTLSETKKRFWTHKQLDALAEGLRSLPAEDRAEVGPLVVPRVPHRHDAIYMPLLLRNPRVMNNGKEFVVYR